MVMTLPSGVSGYYGYGCAFIMRRIGILKASSVLQGVPNNFSQPFYRDSLRERQMIMLYNNTVANLSSRLGSNFRAVISSDLGPTYQCRSIFSPMKKTVCSSDVRSPLLMRPESGTLPAHQPGSAGWTGQDGR